MPDEPQEREFLVQISRQITVWEYTRIPVKARRPEDAAAMVNTALEEYSLGLEPGDGICKTDEDFFNVVEQAFSDSSQGDTEDAGPWTIELVDNERGERVPWQLAGGN